MRLGAVRCIRHGPALWPRVLLQCQHLLHKHIPTRGPRLPRNKQQDASAG